MTGNKNKTNKGRQAPPVVKTGAAPIPGGFVKHFPLIITVLFFSLSFIGILNHEMWRDELQAWLIAREAHSLPDLLHNLRYDGHPFLWHFLLFIISTFTSGPFGMQVLHIVISASFVYLLNRYSPFSIAEKILFTFGYYSFFEFNLISRSYGLGFLLITVICILYKNRRQHYLLISVVLFLLANTQVFGLIFSACFSGILFLDYILHTRSGKFIPLPLTLVFLFILIVAAGWVTSVAQIYPAADNTFPVNYPDAATQDLFTRFQVAFSKLAPSYLALPKLGSIHFWNTGVFDTVVMKGGLLTREAVKLNLFIPVCLFLVFLLYFSRKPLLLLFYSLGTLVLVGFYYYSFLLYSRYCSHLFILLFAAVWLATYYDEVSMKNKILLNLTAAGKTVGKYLFLFLLAVSFIGGVGAWYKDLQYPFSASSQLVEFLKANKLDKEEIVSVPDWGSLAVPAYLQRPCYYPYSKSHGTFLVYDRTRNENVTVGGIIQQVSDLNKKGAKKIVLVQYFPLTFNDAEKGVQPIEDAMISDILHIQLLKTIPAGIVSDELYYVYLIEEKTVG